MGKIIYIDRSRVVTRQECPRKRFFEFDYPTGTDISGIAPRAGSLPLLNGIAIHAAHARLLAGESIEVIVPSVIGDYRKEIESRGVQNFAQALDTPEEKALLDFQAAQREQLIREQSALLEGMLRLWAMKRLPAILEEYELAQFTPLGDVVPYRAVVPGSVPAIELAWEWEMFPGLVQRLRMDAIFRRRDDGLLHIFDYKSVGYPSDDWQSKFEHDLQTELYVQALKERTGEHVGGMLYEGIVKGQYKKDTAKSSPFFGERIQMSPYTYAYRLSGPFDDVWSIDYTAKKGFKKVRTYDEMSMKTWVEEHLQFDANTVHNLFVIVPPIAPPPFELERIKRQVVNQELKWAAQMENYKQLLADDPDGAEEYLDLFAWQNTGRCFKYGMDNRCPFMDPCWLSGVDPLEDGGFEIRKPHHEGELEVAA